MRLLAVQASTPTTPDQHQPTSTTRPTTPGTHLQVIEVIQ
jgi:hypothetical protein